MATTLEAPARNGVPSAEPRQTITQSVTLQDILTAPSEAKSRIIRIGPSLAMEILEHTAFPGQRSVRDSHVNFLASEMVAGTFQLSSFKIDYTKNGPNETGAYLTDGQHRLWGIARSGQTIPMTLQAKPFESFGEIERDYADTDNNLPRSAFDSLAPIIRNGDGRAMLNHKFNFYNSACSILISNFGSPKGRTPELKSRTLRRDILERYQTAWQGYDENALRHGIAIIPLRRAAVIAVGLATFEGQPEKAAEFWGAISRNDGLAPGDPRHSLLNFLMSTKATDYSPGTYCRYVASAWNSWLTNKKVKLLKSVPSDIPMLIEGTHWDGKHVYSVID